MKWLLQFAVAHGAGERNGVPDVAHAGEIHHAALEAQAEAGVADPAKVWAEELKDGCDFVYLLSVEDALLPVFAQLSDDPAKENSLYRVCPGEGPYGVSLQLVE